MRVREALGAVAARLAESSDTPRLDAELLMAHALECEREAMLLSALDDEAPAGFDALVKRRLAKEPIAYIVGRRAFWTIELEVTAAVLIPRADSETLIEAAIAHFDDTGPGRVLDLGTGSGALLLAALDQWSEATGLGIDASPDALAVAEANARRLGLGDRAAFRLNDWVDGLTERFDLILCNPPYVEEGAVLCPGVAEWEPQAALFAGAGGLAVYRLLAPALRPLLNPGGLACVEIGAGQETAVRALFEGEGFSISAHRDLGGHVRCLSLAY
jgi:release factor glutamine methyltransferase